MDEQGVSIDTQHNAARVASRRGPGTPSGSGSHAARDISIQLEAGPSAAAWARSALIPLEQQVDEECMADVRLLVSELVTNSVRHSHSEPPRTVGLDVSFDEDTIRVEVRDRGDGFEPRPRRAGQSKAGGWGLFLVERLADRWGVVRNSVTRVWFEIDLGAVRSV
ncbi:MAG: serine/threonine-protein kinase RsbW [Thermoleophilaceae bacterium]|jgi:anti-sigma regulatory factor (Ser/Thr protein kinase)|nr:serine/threonine-protein kinase RsbW [Thermoleophilaceae bacterium]